MRTESVPTRQFGVVLDLARTNHTIKFVSEGEQARQARRPSECFACGVEPEGGKPGL
jgi:hypothetical protein